MATNCAFIAVVAVMAGQMIAFVGLGFGDLGPG